MSELTIVHALLPSTRLETSDGLVRADRLRPGMRLRRNAAGWAVVRRVATVRPSPAACAARSALRAWTLEPGEIATGLPRGPLQLAAGTPVLLAPRIAGPAAAPPTAMRALDLAHAGIGRLGPPTRPVVLRGLVLDAPDAVRAEGVWVPTGPLAGVPVLPSSVAGLMREADLREGLRRANAGAVLRSPSAARAAGMAA